MLLPEDLYKIVEEEEKQALTAEDTQKWAAWQLRWTETILDFVKDHFQASDGAVVMQRGEITRIPTITPMLTERGCVFLDAGGRCKIWAYAPAGCSHFDVHQTQEEADRRSLQILGACQMAFKTGDHYARAWQWLRDLGNVPPSVQERRGKLQAVLKQLETGDAQEV